MVIYLKVFNNNNNNIIKYGAGVRLNVTQIVISHYYYYLKIKLLDKLP